MHNSARGETQRKTSRVESGSIVMNSGFHLNLAAKLSSVWGLLLDEYMDQLFAKALHLVCEAIYVVAEDIVNPEEFSDSAIPRLMGMGDEG